MSTTTVHVSDEGSSCSFTISDGKITVHRSGGIPVETVLNGADLSGDDEGLKASIEAAFNANGSEYKAVIV